MKNVALPGIVLGSLVLGLTVAPLFGQDQSDTLGAAAPTVTIGLEKVAEGLSNPVTVIPEPGTGRLMAVEQIGVIRVIDEANGGLQEEPFLDIRSRLVQLNEGYDERGLLGLAFHPDYEENGKFYVHYSAPTQPETPEGFNHIARISEFTAGAAGADAAKTADPGTERTVLSIAEPQMNHNSGSLFFGPEGYLFVGFGDGGNWGDVGTGHVEDWYEMNRGGNAQNIDENLLGKIIRIDPNVEEEQPWGSYGIPQDNPFVGTAGLDEIWAYGFRNPYRIMFDEESGRIYSGDAGQELWEEIDLVERGGNYGWNVMEGTHYFSTENRMNTLEEGPTEDPHGNNLVLPIIEYPNLKQGGPGNVIVGGGVYRGEAVPELQGQYVFGFFTSEHEKPAGVLYNAREAGDLWVSDELRIAGKDGNTLEGFLLGFGHDENGEIYVTTTDSPNPFSSNGAVYRITAAQE